MARKKKSSGKKILEIGLRASNLISEASDDHSDVRSDDDDEVFIEMGSTGPKGAKKSRSMADVLNSSNLQCVRVDRVPVNQSGVLDLSAGSSKSSGPKGVLDRVPVDVQLGFLDLNAGSSKFQSPRSKGVLDLSKLKSPGSNGDLSKRQFSGFLDSNGGVLKSPGSNGDLSKRQFSGFLDSNGVLDRNNQSTGSNQAVEEASTILNSGKRDVETRASPNGKADGVLISNETKDKIGKSWISLFSDNRKLGSGMNLNYIPSENKDTVSFDDKEWNEDILIWQSSLIGQVMGLNVKFKAMESYVQKTWKKLLPEICLLKPGLFLFKFKNVDEMNEILCKGPWFFGSRPLLLKQWSNGEEIDKIKDCVYPMWIQLPSLRLNLWNAKSISKIVSTIGCPIATDRLTANRQRLAYARVLVEVKLPSPLPDQIIIQDPKGKKYSQKVIYELKPKWCDTCKQVGHDTKTCRKLVKTQRWIPKQSQNHKPGNIEKDVNATHEQGSVSQKGNSSLIGVAVHDSSVQAEHVHFANTGEQIFGHVNNSHLLSKEMIAEDGIRTAIQASSSGQQAVHRSVHVVHVKEKCPEDNLSPGYSTKGNTPWIQVQNGKKNKDIIHALLETKIKSDRIQSAVQRIARNWNWISNASNQSKARILIMWDSNVFGVQIINISDQSVTCKVNSLDGRMECIITSIYAFNQMEARKVLWDELKSAQQSIRNEPWLLCGDFNTVINSEEKIGGSIVSESDTKDFRDFIDDCHLNQLKTTGCFYTWNNKQDHDSRVWCKLDRALVNDTWLLKYNASQVEFLLPNCSDHSPALVTIFEDCSKGKKPFRYFKMWSKHDSFIPVVSAIWQTKVEGFKMYTVCKRLQLLRGALKELNKRHYANISEQFLRARRALEEAQGRLQNSPLNPEIKANFHQNKVLTLFNALGQRISDQEEIAKEMVLYYKDLLGSDTETITPYTHVIQTGPCLTVAQVDMLSKPVSREEIKSAIFSMDENKAPGPDGYGVAFYKSAWSVIGQEVILAIEEFFKNGKMLGMVNSTSITLIPKIKCPVSPSDYRPISCCNCIYKFISKILANRIRPILGSIVNDAQSAFVKGRQISSNISLAHELAKSYSRKGISPRVMLSIDIRKAFDTVNWKFLKKMLEGLGFPRVMVKWILACISSPRFSISLNGSLHGYFEGKRGLRQGDPLSPYLFILEMEYLSRKLELLKEDKLFRYHPMCGKLKISHLIFADDLLLFAKGDLYSVQKLYHCVKDFSATTGLEANLSKCSIYFGGVNENTKTAITNMLGFSEGTLPFKYLGVPLICKRLTFIDCNPLLDKISGQFQKWLRHSNLSYAGRLQVIKSEILGVQNYWTTNFVLPVKVTQKIDELCRKFLWGKSDTTFRIPLVSWDKVCYRKKQGGLGVFSASVWNLSSALRSLWLKKRILGCGNLKHWDIWHVKAKKENSWMWKQLIKCRDRVVAATGGIDNLKKTLSAFYKDSKLQLSAVYSVFSPGSHMVPWYNTIWGKLNYPKHTFVLWLAVQNRLLTQDRLMRRGTINSNICLLCAGTASETRNHLFFDCPFSREVWLAIMDWLRMTWQSCEWELLMNWFYTRQRGNGFKTNVRRLALAATVYRLWIERNNRFFQKGVTGAAHLVKNIKFDILTICLNSSILDEYRDWIISL
ncbi:uncharacterized protein LOC109833427 [Asparagus officinalis]|uniref:uncharacterized protein LOC109833427 n=1 Tax=Asparagus officinalis TaxID=4686 RepID=UPI00098E0276|nr:uncharacterized protein LOC109833427 [Asparagus officinalis]